MELCIALSIITVFASFAIPLMKTIDFDYYIFPHDYLYQQSVSMLSTEGQDYDNELLQNHVFSISFNEAGNVTKAQTLHFTKGNENKDIVIELGGGHLVFK